MTNVDNKQQSTYTYLVDVKFLRNDCFFNCHPGMSTISKVSVYAENKEMHIIIIYHSNLFMHFIEQIDIASDC